MKLYSPLSIRWGNLRNSGHHNITLHSHEGQAPSGMSS